VSLETKKSFVPVLCGVIGFFILRSAETHHSIAAQFDMTKEIAIEGLILEMEWRNPHAWLQIEANNEDGQPEIWKIEFGSANSLYRRGWRRDDLPVGAKVSINGLPARDGSRVVGAEDVTLPDGRTLFAGTGPEN